MHNAKYSFQDSAYKEEIRRRVRLTVLPRRNAAVAPIVAPIESATNPTGNPKRYPPPSCHIRI